MNAVGQQLPYSDKEIQVAAVIEEFRRNKITGKVILNFKLGELKSGVKELSF